MEEQGREGLAEAAEAAARRLEDAKGTGGHRAANPAQLRVLRRAADRAKLALHRRREDA